MNFHDVLENLSGHPRQSKLEDMQKVDYFMANGAPNFLVYKKLQNELKKIEYTAKCYVMAVFEDEKDERIKKMKNLKELFPQLVELLKDLRINHKERMKQMECEDKSCKNHE